MFKAICKIAIFSMFFIAPQFSFADSLRVSDLSWMEGSWKGTSPAGTYENSFSSASGDLIVGSSKLTNPDGTLGFYEFDEINMADHDLQLTPHPFGQLGVTFKAVETSKKWVVFENSAHDFPKRITYSINEQGQMVLIVEGTQGGHDARLQFNLVKQ